MDNFFIKKYPALGNKNFTRLLTSQFLSLTGGYIQNIALSALITSRTDSRLSLGIFLCVSYLPVFLFSYFAGKLITHISAKAMLITTEMLLFSMSVLLFVLGDMSYPALLVFGAVWGTVRAFQTPAQASVPKLTCDKKALSSGVSSLSLSNSLARAIGPMLSGAVCAFFSYRAAFAVNAFSYIPSLVLLFRSKLQSPNPTSKKKNSKIKLNPFMLTAVFVFSLCGTAYNVIFTGVIKKLGIGNGWLPVFMACLGIGAVIGAYLYSGNRKFMFACLGISLSQVIIAFLGMPYIICIFTILYGFCDYMFFTSAIAKIQSDNSAANVTKAMGIYTIITTGALPLGYLGLGYLIDAAGIGVTLGVTAALGALYYLLFFNKIR